MVFTVAKAQSCVPATSSSSVTPLPTPPPSIYPQTYFLEMVQFSEKINKKQFGPTKMIQSLRIFWALRVYWGVYTVRTVHGGRLGEFCLHIWSFTPSTSPHATSTKATSTKTAEVPHFLFLTIWLFLKKTTIYLTFIMSPLILIKYTHGHWLPSPY